MNPVQRARRMVGYLPPLLQGGERINLVFDAIAQELGSMESGLTRLMRSRWYTLAEGFQADDSLADKAMSELGRLAALYGLEPGRDEETTYFRQRLASLVQLHRSGLGTAPALLLLVAMVYRARLPPEILWEGDTAVGVFTVPGPPEADGTPGTRKIRVELDDNPSTPASARFRGIPADQRLLIINGSLGPEKEGLGPRILPPVPEISLTAPKGISIPVLHHHESGLDVLFLGRIPPGKTLTLRHQRVPLLDGRPAEEPVLLAHPSRFNDENQPVRFDTETARFSVFSRDQRLPELVSGENHWSHGTLSKSQLATYLAGWRETDPQKAQEVERARKKALDVALEPRESVPLDLEFRWTEITPSTFVLRIPVDYVPPQAAGNLPVLVRELAATLNYGRAAGVRARIEFMLTLPPEAVSVDESPAHMALTTAFREPPSTTDKLVSDELTSFGQAIEFQERLPEPDDQLSWSGVFDGTRFETSRFKK